MHLYVAGSTRAAILHSAQNDRCTCASPAHSGLYHERRNIIRHCKTTPKPRKLHADFSAFAKWQDLSCHFATINLSLLPLSGFESRNLVHFASHVSQNCVATSDYFATQNLTWANAIPFQKNRVGTQFCDGFGCRNAISWHTHFPKCSLSTNRGKTHRHASGNLRRATPKATLQPQEPPSHHFSVFLQRAMFRITPVD